MRFGRGRDRRYDHKPTQNLPRAVRKGHTGQRGEVYSAQHIEPLCAARTPRRRTLPTTCRGFNLSNDGISCTPDGDHCETERIAVIPVLLCRTNEEIKQKWCHEKPPDRINFLCILST